ncbi:MAG: 3-hydroxy-3-methylglutaryl-CoA reductase, partial [Myxococcales bacterium]|nr:3-hydroxy-3-methylglutaryl-CoA reductase [Myxococcales bacterium]
MSTSRIPGFYKLDIPQRRELLQKLRGLTGENLNALETGGLDPATCDTMIENVVGQYNLPFGIGLNFRINERDMLLPMVIEEPSVVAAASNAAR